MHHSIVMSLVFDKTNLSKQCRLRMDSDQHGLHSCTRKSVFLNCFLLTEKLSSIEGQLVRGSKSDTG